MSPTYWNLSVVRVPEIDTVLTGCCHGAVVRLAARPEGVYPDGRGGWYFKVSLGRDPLTGRRIQLTRRGFRTAAEAGRARRDVSGKAPAWSAGPRAC
jgi:hypothetical protein